jgi:hypothetical protein
MGRAKGERGNKGTGKRMVRRIGGSGGNGEKERV